MIVLDANVLIAFFDESDAHHLSSVQMLEAYASDGFAASFLTISEFLVHPIRREALPLAQAGLRALGLRTIETTSESMVALAEMRVETGLRLPDAIVLHSARSRSASIGTFDARLAREARRAGVEVVGVAA